MLANVEIAIAVVVKIGEAGFGIIDTPQVKCHGGTFEAGMNLPLPDQPLGGGGK
jgi:hypothetical protein